MLADTVPCTPLLTRRDAAKRLSVSERLVDRLVASGRLKAIYLGRAVRFDPRDVEDALQAMKQSPRKGA